MTTNTVPHPPKRRPSLRRLKSLRSLGDDYFIEEIRDHKNDGHDDWNKITQILFSDNGNDDSNTDDDDNEEDKGRQWEQFENHIKSTYEDFEMKEQNSSLSSLSSFTITNKEANEANIDKKDISSISTNKINTDFPLAEDDEEKAASDEINRKELKNMKSFVVKLISEIESVFENEAKLKGTIAEKMDDSVPNLLFEIKSILNNTGKRTKEKRIKNETDGKKSSNKHSPINDDQKEEEASPQNEIKTKIQSQMKQVLGNKTRNEIKEEAQKEPCYPVFMDDMNKIGRLTPCCEPLKRIEIVLDAYRQLLTTIDKSSWNEIDIGSIIQVDTYGHQEIFNDFLHVTDVHIVADNDVNRSHDHDEQCECKYKYENIAAKICQYFGECTHCNDPQLCAAFTRHYRERTNDERDQCLYFQKSTSQQRNDERNDDIAFQQECDKIHSYFFHSTIKFGTESYQTTAEEEEFIDHINQHSIPIRFSKSYSQDISSLSSHRLCISEEKANVKNIPKKTYVGKKEDDLWWNQVDPQSDAQSDDEIYRILVENMGVFRWQNPQGFTASQNHSISHYKPKYRNIKEEALQNEYEPISKENWNQTLKKSKIFFKSWARRKIRTTYNGYFDDQVTGHNERWKQGVELSMQETVILKLYTDFDKLQFALKKCFRFETFDDILDEDDKLSHKTEVEKKRKDLKNRLESFYHWRGGLLLVLNKFGKKLNHKNNLVLYHGVNAKMIIQPSQTLAFNGPLSTSASYHVARTFATEKGMVLKITSHFPRMSFCNAFDASSISDYPEEQEWLVGFMYVRLLEVRTRKLTNNVSSFWDLFNKVPLSSWVRQEFFAIHLFDEQIFSMSEHLQRILAQFLKVNRKECCDQNQREKYKAKYGYFQDWDLKCVCNVLCKIAHEGGLNNVNDKKMEQHKKEDLSRRKKIVSILWKKFTEFRQEPNLKQRIKFDIVSDHLKRFFMEPTEEKGKDKDEQKWVISFDEITTVYPNVQEIHFINNYKFDDRVLQGLIKQIEKEKDEKKNKIKKIVYLYYNYKQTKANDDTNKPLNGKIFKDPDNLDETLKTKLQHLGWKIKHNKNGSTGYKIRIYNTKK